MKAIFPLLLAVLLSIAQSFPFPCAAQAPRPACGNNSKFGVSAPPRFCPKPGGDFFEPYTGNVQREIRDLELWGSVGELPMAWSRYYTSRGNILWNFSFVYGMYDGPLVGGQPSIVVDYPEGGQNSFVRNPVNPVEWLPPSGIDKKLFQYGSDFILQMGNGFRYRFTKFSITIGPNTYFYYLLQDIKDSRQNLYRLTYTVNRQLDSVIEPAGRFFKVHYTIVGGRRLIGQVNTSDGRLVKYLYDIYNDGVSKWIRFTGAKYGDSTEAKYTYVQPSPGVPLRLAHAVDPRFPGPSVNIMFTYEWSLAGGYIKEEKNGVTGQVMSTLYATDSTRIVCYANGKQEIFRMPSALLGNRQSYTDGLGRTRKHGFDMGGQGFLAKDTDALNRVTSYNARTIYGSLLGMTYPDGSTMSWTRDSLDQVLTQTDELGRVMTYLYDASHRVRRINYPDGSFDSFTYNSFGQVLDHMQRNGGTEHFAYDSRGLKTAHTDAEGNVTLYSYDGSDRLDSITDARGHTTAYQYDERGLMTKIINPDLSATTYTYDTFGNQLTHTDELSHTWTTTYDEFRRPVTMTDPLSRTTRYTYDLPGGICGCAHEQRTPSSVVLPSGKITRTAYDVEWQHTSETTGAGSADSATTFYEYDMVGNIVKIIDPRGKEWEMEYDLRDRKAAETDPLGHRTEWTYDAVGNNLTIKRPDNGTTTYTYDVMNRRTQGTDPKSQVTQYRYDAAGKLDSMIDPNGNVYVYQYDLLDRKIRLIYPGGSFERYGYDAVGNPDSFTNRAGAVCIFSYDNRNRDTAHNWSDTTPDISRSFDLDGRLLGMASSVSTLTYTYNNANELLSETQNVAGSVGGGKTFSYTYNPDGLANTVSYPGGTVLTYSYTGRNQLDSITDGTTPAIVNYTYDQNGYPTQKALKNGTVAVYTYDDENRLLTVDHRLGVSSFARFDYGYDNVHRRTFVQRDLGKGDVYGYDAVDQSTGVQYEATNPGGSPSAPLRTVAYSYDAAGNRASVDDNSVITSYATNSLNQYTSVGGNAHTYNSNGDLASGNGWTYNYDGLNRLIFAASSTDTVHFAYDARNRCVKRIINGAAIYFYFDGWNLIEERNAADVLQQRYVYGPTFDEVLTKTASGATLYYHADALNNTVRLSDNTGTVIEQYAYDIYGAPTIKDGGGTVIAASAYGNRFLFTGREYIRETGLYDYRHRMYSPALGRFLQTDPISFGSGDVNLYLYVGNNPVNLRDPSGLKPTKESGAKALADALPLMKRYCECCVEQAKIELCKTDAKKIVDGLVALWKDKFGKGPYSDAGDPVGGYFCWDWAVGFQNVAEKVNSDIWGSDFRRFDAPPTPTGIPVHFAARIFIKKPLLRNCAVSVDDGFFEDGLVHKPSWPSRTDYKENTTDPDPRKIHGIKNRLKLP